MTTINILQELYKLYDAFNEHYFSSSLPDVFITIQSGVTRTDPWKGMFYNDQYVKTTKTVDEYGEATYTIDDAKYEIGIAGEHLNDPYEEVATTLLHEMIHLYCRIKGIKDTNSTGVKHTKRFKAECESRNLDVDYDDKHGWAVTSPTQVFKQMLDNIDIDSTAFEYYRKTTLPETKTTTKKAYICPVCKTKVSGKTDIHLICGECNKPFDYWDLTDPDYPKILMDYNDGLAMSEDGWYGMEFGMER